MNNFELAVFDMDGLIFDTERAFMNELKCVMASYGYELTKDIYVSTIGLTGAPLLNKMLSYYGNNYPFKEISKKARNRVSCLANNGKIAVKKGIEELLKFLSDSNIICAVASSTKSDYVDSYLKAANIRKYFKSITGGEEVEHSKPEPDIFLRACYKENISPKNAVVFEDSPNGIRAAVKAGIPVFCIPDLVIPEEELINKLEFLANDAFDVIEYIKK